MACAIFQRQVPGIPADQTLDRGVDTCDNGSQSTSLDCSFPAWELSRWPPSAASSSWPATVLLAVVSSAPTFGGENTQFSGIKPEPVRTSTAAGRAGSSLAPRTAARERPPPIASVATVSCPMHWRGLYFAGFGTRNRRPNGKRKPWNRRSFRVANWSQLDEVEYQLFYDFDEPKKKQSRGTEAILNALILTGLDDRFEGRPQPGADTKKALSILWATQVTTGEHKGSWDWLNFGLEPWESTSSRYRRDGSGDRRRRGPRGESRRQWRRLT